ncbi:NAD(P)/FAD-dependent oxidoreductase [Thermoanaerobacterium thermosaccharolyticum]|uniref:NAD(P)/FAD-dependent oxidoreductase n=1 Tax=Thermoanaerobacterium thermosaccharolyticum TaxID=1517 RepID=UPI001782C3A8|nr:geranylgeranyl reductase family protein [Thermoanaerobacterium thermosaccharolyticum]MBE0067601.1 geranylgeranyl reductase family protein [Thermoanaerobacterium thermosaccharolyticum]MBE0227185.1 geranylgeranyl reductase family protein [Thermoanaerobacterium thermosaccharolyticum]
MYDVIIIGGGPAGSTLARRLSAQGYKALLIEKYTMPRYKACGGGITPRCYKMLDLDISDYVEDTTYKIAFKFPNNKSVVLETEKPIIYQVDRTKFDKYLIDKAVESGCDVHDGEKFLDFYRDGKEVVVKTDRGQYKTRILVGADGINSTVAYKANLLNGEKGIALEAEVYVDKCDIEKVRGEVVVDFNAIKYGYGWVFPKKDRLSIGVGTFLSKTSKIKENLSNMIDENVVGNVEECKIYGHQLSFPNGKDGIYNNDKVILIGDATRLADPFTGEGIYNAILTANISFDVIEKYFNGKCELSEYTERLRREVVPDIKWAHRLSLFTYNNMGFIEKSVKYFSNVLSYFIDIMMGDNNYINYKLKVPLYALHIKNSKTKIKVKNDVAHI